MSSIDSREVGRSMMQHTTLKIDMRQAMRTAFGFFHWRLRLLVTLIWIACRVLRCKYQFIKS